MSPTYHPEGNICEHGRQWDAPYPSEGVPYAAIPDFPNHCIHCLHAEVERLKDQVENLLHRATTEEAAEIAEQAQARAEQAKARLAWVTETLRNRRVPGGCIELSAEQTIRAALALTVSLMNDSGRESQAEARLAKVVKAGNRMVTHLPRTLDQPHSAELEWRRWVDVLLAVRVDWHTPTCDEIMRRIGPLAAAQDASPEVKP